MEQASTGTHADAGADVPVLDVDPFDPAVLGDPHPVWERMRDAGPVVWIPKYEYYLIARHAEVLDVQNRWEAFTTTGGAGMPDIRKPDSWRPASAITETDPPRHTTVRKVLNRILSPIVVRGWRERFEEAAAQLADEVVAKREFDGVRDVSEAYVLTVFPEMLGLDINRQQAIAVGDLNFNSLGPKNELVEASEKAVEPILQWWNESLSGQRMQPGGVGEQLFKAEEAGEFEAGMGSRLTMVFLRGGLDTTISSIGSGLRLLAEHPEQWKMLRENPGLLRGTFEETLRLESPIQTNFRTTVDPCEISGLRLKPDVKVQLMVGSANRDPRKWEDPERFDITRDTAGHVALGNGIHACLGQMLARLEFECILRALLERIETLELVGEPVHRKNNALRTLDTLPLRAS